jgi:hypothetical protein
LWNKVPVNLYQSITFYNNCIMLHQILSQSELSSALWNIYGLKTALKFFLYY